MQALFQGTYYSLPRTSNHNRQSKRLSHEFTLIINNQYVKYKRHLIGYFKYLDSRRLMSLVGTWTWDFWHVNFYCLTVSIGKTGIGL